MPTAFQANGRTVAAMANGTAAGFVNVSADAPSSTYQFVNTGNITVWVRISGAISNTTTAVVPTPGSPAYGMPLLAGTSLLYAGWQAGPFSNVSVGFVALGTPNIATALVYITPGEGP